MPRLLFIFLLLIPSYLLADSPYACNGLMEAKADSLRSECSSAYICEQLRKVTNDPIDRKIGQMLIVGFRGTEVSQESKILRDIESGSVGGVILYLDDIQTRTDKRNIESKEQLSRLCLQLQSAANIPIFVAIDQEGGAVDRLPARLGFPDTVTAEYLGILNDPTVTRIFAKQCAETLSSTGINLNFAPVVDLNVNPNNPIIAGRHRSFSADPGIVSLHASIFVEEHQKAKILTALKHFPGHGSSELDTHEDFVDITQTWKTEELDPYIHFIAQGYQDIIMTGHLFQGGLDPEYPATLSRKIITNMLREQLQFKGVVISDDLQMGAIQSKYSLETSIEKAINAGVDILLFSNQQSYNEGIADKAIKIIKKLMAEGKLSEERIEESYQRILKLKHKLYQTQKINE